MDYYVHQLFSETAHAVGTSTNALELSLALLMVVVLVVAVVYLVPRSPTVAETLAETLAGEHSKNYVWLRHRGALVVIAYLNVTDEDGRVTNEWFDLMVATKSRAEWSIKRLATAPIRGFFARLFATAQTEARSRRIYDLRGATAQMDSEMERNLEFIDAQFEIFAGDSRSSRTLSCGRQRLWWLDKPKIHAVRLTGVKHLLLNPKRVLEFVDAMIAIMDKLGVPPGDEPW